MEGEVTSPARASNMKLIVPEIETEMGGGSARRRLTTERVKEEESVQDRDDRDKDQERARDTEMSGD